MASSTIPRCLLRSITADNGWVECPNLRTNTPSIRVFKPRHSNSKLPDQVEILLSPHFCFEVSNPGSYDYTLRPLPRFGKRIATNYGTSQNNHYNRQLRPSKHYHSSPPTEDMARIKLRAAFRNKASRLSYKKCPLGQLV